MAYSKGWPVDGSWTISQSYQEHIERAKANGWCYQKGQSPCQDYYYPGEDIACPVGTVAYATRPGIASIKNEGDAGYGLRLDIIGGGGVTILYAHLSAILVNSGDEIREGEIVALTGNSGNSTGPHLHYERRLNGNPVYPFQDETPQDEDIQPPPPPDPEKPPKTWVTPVIYGYVGIVQGGKIKFKQVRVFSRKPARK